MNNKLKELCEKAGFSTEVQGNWPTTIGVGKPLENLIALVVEDCAVAAELHARSYADGDSGTGAIGAAHAVRTYGSNLFK